MAKTISEIRKGVEERGIAWTPELHTYALSKGAVDDTPPPVDLSPAMAYTGPNTALAPYNPMLANAAAGLISGRTFGLSSRAIPKQQYPTSTKVGGFLANVLAPVAGETYGFMQTAGKIPVSAPFNASTAIGKTVAKAAPVAERLGKYGLVAGGIEGARDGGGVRGALRGAAERGATDAGIGLGLGLVPSLPKAIGGDYLKSALTMGGLTAAQGGSVPEVLAAAMTGAGAEAAGAGVFKEAQHPNYERPAPNKRGKGAGETVGAVFRTTEGQLQRLSPEGQVVAEKARSVIDESREGVGEGSAPLVKAKANKLKGSDDVDVFRALNGTPLVLNKKARVAYEAARGYLDAFPARAQAEGIKVRVRGKTEAVPQQSTETGEVTFKKVKVPGKWVDFPDARPDYAPHITPEVSEMKAGRGGKSGKIRTDILNRLVDDGVFPDRPTAVKMLDSYVATIESGGRGGTNAFAQHLVDSGQATSLSAAKGKILMWNKRSKQSTFSPIERARQFDNPFWDPSLRRIMPKYIEGAERRLAETRHYGQRLDKLASVMGKVKEPGERQLLDSLVDAARGQVKKENPLLMSAGAKVRRIGSYALNPVTALRNLGQINGILLNSDVQSFVYGGVKALTPEGRALAHRSGATAGVVLRDIENVGGASGRYYKAIGMTGTEMFMRSWAANAGARYADTMAKRLVADPADTFARNQLKKLRISADEVLAQGGLTDKQLLRGGFKMSDRTQFGYTALDVPPWFNDTVLGRLVSQFKPYGVQQSRMLIQEVADEARAGNYGRATRALVLIATLYPATGEVLNDIAALATGKKRDKDFGSLERYLENITQAGVTNALVDGYQSTKYRSGAKALIGPAPAMGVDASAALLNMISTGKMTEADARRLWRMIPGVGPLTAYRVFPKD
jgi:hypothetical protein